MTYLDTRLVAVQESSCGISSSPHTPPAQVGGTAGTNVGTAFSRDARFGFERIFFRVLLFFRFPPYPVLVLSETAD